MEELPFSPEIKTFEKPIEVGDTNKIYYDPNHPESVIRVPTDEEARFLENEPALIGIAEKIYGQLGEMGKSLDIEIAPHQFILAKETGDGPIKPMLIEKRIEGRHLVPIDRNDPETLDAISRIAQLGFKYLDWIDTNKPQEVVTDIFRPEQYLAHPGNEREILTLIDVEPRLKDSDYGVMSISQTLGMLVCPLRDSSYNETFNQFMQYAIKSLKQNRNDNHLTSLIHIIINFPEIYERMSDDLLNNKETSPFSTEINERIRNTPLVINREILAKFGIEKA